MNRRLSQHKRRGCRIICTSRKRWLANKRPHNALGRVFLGQRPDSVLLQQVTNVWPVVDVAVHLPERGQILAVHHTDTVWATSVGI